MGYQAGFGMVACLVACSVCLHREIVCPHLPPSGTHADDMFFWGLVAAAGIASQACLIIEVNYGWRTLAQRFGGVVIAFAVFKHMNASISIYLPGAAPGCFGWKQMLKDWLMQMADHRMSEESEEARVLAEQLRSAFEFAQNPKLLQNPTVARWVFIRYMALSCWPWCIMLLPIFSSILERVPEKSKVAGSSLLRSLFAWLQWMILLICTLMHLSYAPDMYHASLLPIPSSGEDGF